MKNFKYPLIAGFCCLLLGSGIGLDIWFAPHRDVKTVPVFQEFHVDDFTEEFLKDYNAANEKYLASDGDSKIVCMTGNVSDIDTNLAGKIVIYLTGDSKAGVYFTLLEEENKKATNLKVGDKIKLNGVVSSGAMFDEDFNRYLDGIIEQAYFD